MEENRENQIWQRVLAQPERKAAGDLQTLLREAEALAAVYRRIPHPLAKRLREGELANAACLRGIGLLSGEKTEVVKLWEPAGKPDLRSCYHRTRRCQAEYAARSLDGEFGEVFRKMAHREAEHLSLLARLLGETG